MRFLPHGFVLSAAALLLDPVTIGAFADSPAGSTLPTATFSIFDIQALALRSAAAFAVPPVTLPIIIEAETRTPAADPILIEFLAAVGIDNESNRRGILPYLRALRYTEEKWAELIANCPPYYELPAWALLKIANYPSTFVASLKRMMKRASRETGQNVRIEGLNKGSVSPQKESSVARNKSDRVFQLLFNAMSWHVSHPPDDDLIALAEGAPEPIYKTASGTGVVGWSFLPNRRIHFMRLTSKQHYAIDWTWPPGKGLIFLLSSTGSGRTRLYGPPLMAWDSANPEMQLRTAVEFLDEYRSLTEAMVRLSLPDPLPRRALRVAKKSKLTGAA